MKQVSSRQ